MKKYRVWCRDAGLSRPLNIVSTSDQGRTSFAVSAHFLRSFFGHSPKHHRRNPEETAKKLTTWHGGRSGLSGLSSPLQPLVFRTSFLRDAFVIRSWCHAFKHTAKVALPDMGFCAIWYVSCDLRTFCWEKLNVDVFSQGKSPPAFWKRRRPFW